MIAKKDLIHGAYYWGSCRNAQTARWNGITEKFVYWRHTFGKRYVEDINHPEDDNGFDLFVPTEEVTCGTPSIPLEA